MRVFLLNFFHQLLRRARTLLRVLLTFCLSLPGVGFGRSFSSQTVVCRWWSLVGTAKTKLHRRMGSEDGTSQKHSTLPEGYVFRTTNFEPKSSGRPSPDIARRSERILNLVAFLSGGQQKEEPTKKNPIPAPSSCTVLPAGSSEAKKKTGRDQEVAENGLASGIRIT